MKKGGEKAVFGLASQEIKKKGGEKEAKTGLANRKKRKKLGG